MARASSVDSTWVGTLAAGVSIGGTSSSLSSVSGTNWPSGSGIFGIQIGEDPDDDAELVQVTRSGTTLTNDASTPTFTKAHSAGANVYYLTTAPDINAKADATHTHAATDIGSGSVSDTEFGYLDGVTSAIQTQLNAKQASDSDLTSIAGLTPSNDDVIQRKSGSWVNRTLAQLWDDLTGVARTITGAMTFTGGADFSGNSIFSGGTVSMDDLTTGILRQNAQILSTDWMTTFYGFNNTFTSTNNRTSVQTTMSVDVDPIDTGLQTSSTTYAVNTTTGEVVAISGSFGSGTLGITRGRLTGIGAAAAAAITSGDVWYVLPYGYYAVDLAFLIDNAFDYDSIQFNGDGVWMPMTILLPDPTTYMNGRKLNLLLNPDLFGGAPLDVDFAAGTFAADFTISSGFKSMFLAPTPDNSDYLHIGAY